MALRTLVIKSQDEFQNNFNINMCNFAQKKLSKEDNRRHQHTKTLTE